MPDPCLVSSPRIQLDLIAQGGVDALTADVILSAAAEQGLALNSDGLWAPRAPIVVGSMPAGPTDGMERYVVAGDQLWHLRRYSNTWYVVGGPPLVSVDAAGNAGWTIGADSGAAWHLHSGGPTITVPYAGNFVCEWGAHVNPSAPAAALRLGLSVNSGDPTADRWCGMTGAAGSGVSGPGYVSIARLWQLTLAANDVLKLSSWDSGASGSQQGIHRWLKLTPRTLS